MLRSSLLTFFVTAMGFAVTFSSHAQTPCSHRDKIIDRLQSVYNESRSAVALVHNGNMLEVLTSPSGSWSIIITSPQGFSCLMSSGTGWEHTPQISLDPPA